MEEEISRQDQEQRRRKLILQQEKNHQEDQSKELEKIMLTKLMRQSKQERRIAEQLMQIRNEV